MSSRHGRGKLFFSATTPASAQKVKSTCVGSVMAFLIAEGSVAGGQTTTSDGLFQARDDSVLRERLAAGYYDFPVQPRSADLPVSGAFVEKVTEMERTERSLLLSNSQHGRKIHVAKWTPHGIHQTRTAIAHARQHQEIFSATIRFNGNRKDTVSQRLASFAKFPSIDGGEKSYIKVTGRQGRELAEKANTFHDG